MLCIHSVTTMLGCVELYLPDSLVPLPGCLWGCPKVPILTIGSPISIGGGSGCSAPIPPEAVSDSPQSSRASPTDRAHSLAARGLEHLQSVLLKYLVPQFYTRIICDELPCLFDVNHESAARQPLSLLLA